MSTEPANLLFQDLYFSLYREVQKVVGKDNYEEAFVNWLLPGLFENLDPKRVSNQVIARFTISKDYKDLAALGFVASSGNLEVLHYPLLNSGLNRIAGREPSMEGVPASFTSDILAILGIALGASYLEDTSTINKVSNWISRFAEITYRSRGIEDWQKCLFAAAQRKIGLEVKNDYQLPQTADVCVALRSVNLLSIPTQEKAEEDEREALLLLKREWNCANLNRAALRISAFNWINRATPSINLNRLTVEQVANLLRRVPASFRRWPWENKPKTPNSHIQKWNIENEYHVQSLLYALLAPIFPDLKDEEYTPPVGPKHPRADLTIPSLKLIIEVKFMYSITTPQKMVEQIAEDSSFYLVEGSSYSKIITFIWDSGAKFEHHDTMIQGMKQIRGVVDAIVMSRPSFMNANSLSNDATNPN